MLPSGEVLEGAGPVCPQRPRRSSSALLARATITLNPRLCLGNLREPGVTRNWICKRHSFVCQHLQWEGHLMRLPGRSSRPHLQQGLCNCPLLAPESCSVLPGDLAKRAVSPRDGTDLQMFACKELQ